MRYVILPVMLWCLVGGAAGAQPADPQLMAPIQKFMDSFNKGDVAGAAATHASTADLTIVDEVPPFVWRGAQAFTAWSAALDADAKKNGITEPMVSIAPATRVETSGDVAYVIVPATYSFKKGGAAMREAAQMTFVMKKAGGAWLIHGWTWTGPRPAPAQ